MLIYKEVKGVFILVKNNFLKNKKIHGVFNKLYIAFFHLTKEIKNKKVHFYDTVLFEIN